MPKGVYFILTGPFQILVLIGPTFQSDVLFSLKSARSVKVVLQNLSKMSASYSACLTYPCTIRIWRKQPYFRPHFEL